MGIICHSSDVSTTQSARDNGDTNIDISGQHDVSATWKLSEIMNPAGVTSICTTIPNAVQLHETSEPCLVTERPRVRSFEAVSYYDLAQNLQGNSAVLDFKERPR